MSNFQELIELKNQIGVKKFKSQFQKKFKEIQEENSEQSSDNNEEAESSSDEEETASVPKRKRDKNEPMEMSSKKAVSRKRTVVESASSKNTIYRDPRFEPLAGTLNPGLFKRSYGFLHEYQESEIKSMRDKLKKEGDMEVRAQIKYSLDSLLSRRNARLAKEKAGQQKSEWRRKEKEMVMNGKKPFYLKKSEIKKRELKSKFKEIEQGGNLGKFLEKRRKRNAAKEHTKIPSSRRMPSSNA